MKPWDGKEYNISTLTELDYLEILDMSDATFMRFTKNATVHIRPGRKYTKTERIFIVGNKEFGSIKEAKKEIDSWGKEK